MTRGEELLINFNLRKTSIFSSPQNLLSQILSILRISFWLCLFYFSTWWPKLRLCTLEAQPRPALEVIPEAWEAPAVLEEPWVSAEVEVREAREVTLVGMWNRISVNNASRLFLPITNWSSTYGCTLEKNPTNVHIVTGGSSNCRMCSSTLDYTPVTIPNVKASMF